MRNNFYRDIGKMVQDGIRATPSFQLDTSSVLEVMINSSNNAQIYIAILF
jgi:hypothetical protein